MNEDERANSSCGIVCQVENAQKWNIIFFFMPGILWLPIPDPPIHVPSQLMLKKCQNKFMSDGLTCSSLLCLWWAQMWWLGLLIVLPCLLMLVNNNCTKNTCGGHFIFVPSKTEATEERFQQNLQVGIYICVQAVSQFLDTVFQKELVRKAAYHRTDLTVETPVPMDSQSCWALSHWVCYSKGGIMMRSAWLVLVAMRIMTHFEASYSVIVVSKG